MISFHTPIKIKHAPLMPIIIMMLWLIIPSIAYKTCIIFYNHTKLDQYLHQIFQLAYCQPLSAFKIHIIQVFTNIKRFITFTFTYASIPNKPIITPAFINKFSTFKPAFIIILTLFIKHLHLTYTYMPKSHAKTHNEFSLVFDELHTLIFMF